MEFKGSKTEKNLMDAFAGESQARNKYTYYASKAKKDGFEQIASFFEETANNEKEHAKLWFKEFHGIADTYANLLDAAAGEHEEWTEMYKRMADEADAEGFTEIATRMRLIASVEKAHEERYLALAKNIKEEFVFKKEGDEVVWECRNCGYRVKGNEAPTVCPACNHPEAYFQVEPKNY